MRSRFASSGRLSSREIVCVKRRCPGIRCSIRLRIGGSATGVLITDDCHDIVRRWEQCAPGTSAAPEQKVRQNKTLTGRLAAGDGPPTSDQIDPTTICHECRTREPQFAGEEGDAFGSVGALVARPPNPPSASEQARHSVGVGGNLSWDCALTRANAPRERVVPKRS